MTITEPEKFSLYSPKALEGVPEPFRPPTGTLRVSTEQAKKFSIQKPLSKLPKLLQLDTQSPLFPPRFHWGIALPVHAISDYVKLRRQYPSKSPGECERFLLDYPEQQLEPPSPRSGPAFLVPDDLPDADGQPLLTSNRNPQWDRLLVKEVIQFIEEKQKIPSGSVRSMTSTYRNHHFILSFYSSYEQEDLRMSEDEINRFLKELGIPNAEKWWWCTDYSWSFEIREP